MIHKLFTIYDVKADAYLPPFILPKIEMAQRTFGDCIAAEDHQFSQHPEDYTLFDLGTYNDENAQYELYNAPHSLGNGLEYVRNQSDQDKSNGQAQPLSNEASVFSSPLGQDPEE